MRDDVGAHVESRLRALADGELSPPEAARVEAHCAACPSCAAALAGIRELRALLATDAGPEPLRPLWPGVRDALPRSRRGSGRPSLAYLVGASALAAAGLFLGLHLGAETAATPASVTAESGWAGLSSTLGSGGPGNLAGVYLTDVGTGQ